MSSQEAFNEDYACELREIELEADMDRQEYAYWKDFFANGRDKQVGCWREFFKHEKMKSLQKRHNDYLRLLKETQEAIKMLQECSTVGSP